MSKVLCVYHGGCDDGFAAAWAVRRVLGDDAVEFYPGVYQKEPPDVTGRDVVLVDFSYKRPVIDQMIERCRSLLILDHHKTAQADLAGLPSAGVSLHEWAQKAAGAVQPAVGALFDMHRSGAGIAWDFFNNLAHTETQTELNADAHNARPDFINYIEDRDLWRKALPEGDQFTIALRSYPQDFQVWDSLVARGVPRLIEEGRNIWRYYRTVCDQLTTDAYITHLADHACWMVNAPYFAASEVAGDLAERALIFGASYFQRADGMWQYSLRSRSDFDVSEIAKRFGGGGHAKAAGFAVSEPVHKRADVG